MTGSVLGLLEYLHATPIGKTPLPFGLLFVFSVVSATWVSVAWLTAELGCGLVSPRWRPSNRTPLLVLLTLAATIVSSRIDGGGLTLDKPRFYIEAVAVASVAIVLARLYARATSRVRRVVLVVVLLSVMAASIPRVATAIWRSRVDSERSRVEAPNLVLIVVDTLRVDRLSLFGAERRTTPRLEALARESFLFRRAYTPSAWTSPSVASIFTGLRANEHELARATDHLSERTKTLAERLRAVGVRTFASSGNGLISARYGFDRGFEEFHDPPGAAFFRTRIGFLVKKVCDRLRLASLATLHVHAQDAFLREGEGSFQRSATRIVGDFREWLGRSGEVRFFAYLHLVEPHDPYDPQAPFLGSFGVRSPSDRMVPPVRGKFGARAPYDSWPPSVRPVPEARDDSFIRELLGRYDEEVLATDHAIGEVIDELARRSLLERTVVAVASDHGEEFQDRGGWLHGHQCFDELVRGLLIIRDPQVRNQGESEIPVSLTSLAPDLARRVGVRWEGANGISSLPVLDRLAPIFIDLEPFASGQNGCSAVVDGTWKLVRQRNAREPEQEWLFDLSGDAEETRNLASAHQAVRNRLAHWLDATRSGRVHDPASARPPPDHLLDDLRALGYVQ